MRDLDVAIIGAGAAGLSVAAMAAGLGRKVTVFERAPADHRRPADAAIMVKALLAAAHRMRGLRQGRDLGIVAEGVTVDWPRLRHHLAATAAGSAGRSALQELAGHGEGHGEGQQAGHGIEVIGARAFFTGPDRIQAGDRSYRFRRAVIAAGCEPLLPDLPGLVNAPWCTPDGLAELPALPMHLLVLGGTPMGLEAAQAFARLGSRVSLIEASPNLLAQEDAELRLPLREALRRDGVGLHENTRVLAAERTGAGIALLTAEGARIEGSHLLIALGETPRLAPLDLAAGGIAASERGIATGRDLRSRSNRRVWAAGNVADPEGLGPRRFTRLAARHAEVIARSMLFRRRAVLDYARLPLRLDTTPQLVRVGLTAQQARERHREVEVLRQDFSGLDATLAGGTVTGEVQLVLGPGRTLLGAAAVGDGVGELGALFTLALERGVRLHELATLDLPWPSLAEAARLAADKPYAGQRFSPILRQLASWLGRLP